MNCSRNVLYVGQRPVAAAEPPAAWLGGKRYLAKPICHILAATDHDAYVEPFIGMGGGVFLRRRVRPSVEVINDISGDIVTLFRVQQRFLDALLRELRWRPATRSEFARLNETQYCDLFAWADIEAVQTTYTIAGGDKASTAAELLIGKGVKLAPAAAQASLF